MVLGGHRQIVLVRPSGAALALQVLHYPEQVRSFPLAAVRLAEKAGEELRLAGLLIDAAAGTIDWSAYRDQAAQELKALIEAKLAGHPVATLEPERAILPLLEALQQSVAAQNGRAAAPPVKSKAPRKRSRRTA
jgi:non-homologous end joining protein Ku